MFFSFATSRQGGLEINYRGKGHVGAIGRLMEGKFRGSSPSKAENLSVAGATARKRERSVGGAFALPEGFLFFKNFGR